MRLGLGHVRREFRADLQWCVCVDGFLGSKILSPAS